LSVPNTAVLGTRLKPVNQKSDISKIQRSFFNIKTKSCQRQLLLTPDF